MAIGILKTECEVRSPSNRRAPMLEEVTLMAMCMSHQTSANNTLYTKVLPDPPTSSKKNIRPSPWAIVLNTAMTIVSWQMLSCGRF
jgi:hypothetical protein